MLGIGEIFFWQIADKYQYVSGMFKKDEVDKNKNKPL